MKKILLVAFAWAMCMNLGFAFGELRWHKCENIIDNKQGESALRWRKCGDSYESANFDKVGESSNGESAYQSLRGSLSDSENNEAIQKEKCVDCHESTQSVDSRNDESTANIAESTTNRNAFFAGIELGYMNFEYKSSDRNGTSNPNSAITRGVFDMGILWGYRHFFGDSVGIRAFANMNYRYGNVGDFGELKMLNLGVNADFLLNFYASQNVDFGAFFGFGFGGDIFDGGGVKKVRESMGEHSAKLSSPNVSVNLGLQIVAINKVGIEFVAKIPLLAHYFLNEGDGKLVSNTRKFSQNYSLNARVVWHF